MAIIINLNNGYYCNCATYNDLVEKLCKGQRVNVRANYAQLQTCRI